MNKRHRKLAKLAAKIADQIRPGLPTPSTHLPEYAYHKLKEAAETINRLLMRGKIEYALKYLPMLRLNTRYMICELQTIEDWHAAHFDKPPKFTLSAHEIYRELAQLEKDWGELKLGRDGAISVTTGDIELEGVELRRFEIRLYASDLPSKKFRVIALDPNPSRANDNVTHPHVNSGNLCEGEAEIALKNNLEQGMLGEFFETVASVLNTYNPDSPFIPLEDWDAIYCQSCDGNAREIVSCNQCRYEACAECMSYCCDCEECFCQDCLSYAGLARSYLCDDCIVSCRQCGDSGSSDNFDQDQNGDDLCGACRATCDDCGKLFNINHLTDGLCDDCDNPEPEESEDGDEDESESGETDAEPAVHALGVGEAPVSS